MVRLTDDTELARKIQVVIKEHFGPEPVSQIITALALERVKLILEAEWIESLFCAIQFD